MRRILIDTRIQDIADRYNTCLQHRTSFFDGKQNHIVCPIEKLESLKEKFNNEDIKETIKESDGKIRRFRLKDRDRFIDYIHEIIDNYSKCLLTIKPKNIEELNKIMLSKLSHTSRLNAFIQLRDGKKSKQFYELIVDAMQYDMIRKWILPTFIKEVGVKTCVYCNANYTITGDKGHAFYDIDHWRPKSKYPWACISFFNLQPSCHTCNQLKNDDDDLNYMGLYESDTSKPLDVLHFSLNVSGLADFIINHNDKNLKVQLQAYNSIDKPISIKQNSKLLIDEIYAQHLDVIQETVWRKLITNDSWKESLQESKLKLNITDKDIDRILTGGYIHHEDTHKRPLSRLIQDIIEMDLSYITLKLSE